MKKRPENKIKQKIINSVTKAAIKTKQYINESDMIAFLKIFGRHSASSQKQHLYEDILKNPGRYKAFTFVDNRICCLNDEGNKLEWKSQKEIVEQYYKDCDKQFGDSSSYNPGYAIEELDINSWGSLGDIVDSIMFPQFLPPAVCAKLMLDPMLATAIAKIPSKIISTWIKINYIGKSEKGEKKDSEKINKNIQTINDEMLKFKVPALLYKATFLASAMGSCLIFIDNGDLDLSTPLIVDDYGMPVGSLQGLRIIENWQYTVVESNWTQPLEPDYNEAIMYYIYNQYVHHSRCILIKNDIYPISTLYSQQYNYGSQSLIERILPVWKMFCARMNLTTDVMLKQNWVTYKTDAINMQGGGGQALLNELKQFQLLRDNFGIMIVDYERGEVSVEHYHMTEWSKLDADAFSLLAVMLDIPQSKVAMTPPPGFNASGDFDEQAFNDKCDILRKINLSDAFNKLVLLTKQNSLGEKEGATYSWVFKPLHALTEAESVNILKEFAQSITMLVKDAKVLSPQDARSLLINLYEIFGILDEDIPEDTLKDEPVTELDS